MSNVMELGITQEGRTISAFKGNRLRAKREAIELTQQELAERIGVRKAQISHYENGKAEPSAGVLANMAQVLSVTTDYLLGVVDTPNEHLSRGELSSDELYVLELWRTFSAAQWMQAGANRAAAEAEKLKK